MLRNVNVFACVRNCVRMFMLDLYQHGHFGKSDSAVFGLSENHRSCDGDKKDKIEELSAKFWVEWHRVDETRPIGSK